jgi:hypothetical protein
MKFLKIINIGLGLISLPFFIVSCVKSRQDLVPGTDGDFNNKTMIQVYDATLGSTRNYVYVDASPVTGSAIAYGGTFPVGATPANFAITSGFREFLIKDTLATSTQPQLSFAESFQPVSNYTIFMYDTANAAKQKTVRTNIVIPDDTTARLRFANFVYSPFPVPAVDIFSVNRNANIFSNISVTEVTDFISYQSNKNDTLYVRAAGSGTNLMNKNSSGVFSPFFLVINPTRLRSYTVIFRGGWRSDLSTAATVRTLSLFANN